MTAPVAAALVLAFVLVGCGSAARSHDRWDPSAPAAPAISASSRPAAVTPAAPESGAASSATPHPSRAYADAEAQIHAHISALALRAADAVVAAHAEAALVGPELIWYPTLRQVAARRRHVTYQAPRAGQVLRGSDPQQPFLIEVLIACTVHTTSGDGVPYTGEAPSSEAVHGAQVLPQDTRASDIDAVDVAVRPAAEAAVAALAGVEPLAEVVQVTLLFAYRRAQDDVVLVRHAQEDPPP